MSDGTTKLKPPSSYHYSYYIYNISIYIYTYLYTIASNQTIANRQVTFQDGIDMYESMNDVILIGF